ncbi:MAG: DUF4147 domain-containing protein [Leptolyngbya sp. PLA3]|nr:MAG: DUF4147 domain-containing protein [Cyanobacteria bacterium CYA]MCE7967212.1 DUF4147 domain-containing protein [Leptolyngbya sp. PL-A3]
MNRAAAMLREEIAPEVLRACDAGEALSRFADRLPGEPHGLVLLAMGKGSSAMAATGLRLWGERVARGLVVTRAEHVQDTERAGGRVEVLAADHPIPSLRNVEAAHAVERFVGEAGGHERLVVLLSGGASAQLSAPREPLALDDMAGLTEALLRSGATINEINCVRKHCERVKGGQLARVRVGGATSVFVLSDVLGDPLDVISSGPLAPDPTTFSDAVRVMERHGLGGDHADVMALLRRGVRGEEIETPKPGDRVFASVEHHVVASNVLAVEAACEALRRRGLRIVGVEQRVQGEAGVVGARLGEVVRGLPTGAAVVWGGESTVHVGASHGKGGRNQELAVAAATVIEGVPGAAVMSLATDGVDGPTDAAGGVVDGQSVARMRANGVDPEEALRNHDSYPALEACGGLLRTGASGTNVNDVMVGVRH